MIRKIHLDSLADGQSLIATEVSDEAVERTAEQLAESGIDTPLVVYPDGERYLVVDDSLRLAALRHLAARNRLEAVAPGGYVDCEVVASETEAIQTAADRVVRAQRGPVEQAIYAQWLIAERRKSGPNPFGVRHRSDGQACPDNQQPGPKQFLRKRFGFTLESARQTNHCTRIPRDVLEEARTVEGLSKAKLVAAGQAIYHDPEGDPDEIARARLFRDDAPTAASGTASEDDALADDTSAADDIAAPAKPAAAAKTATKRETAASGETATPQTAAPEPLAATVCEMHRIWSAADRRRFWQQLINDLAALYGADRAALEHAVQAFLETLDQPARDSAVAVEDGATADDDRPRSGDAAWKASGPSATGATSARDDEDSDATPALAAAQREPSPASSSGDKRIRDHAGVDQVVRNGTRRHKSGAGQPNDGPRGGVCDDAAAYKALVKRLIPEFETQGAVADAAGVPRGCISSLMQDRRNLSCKNAAKLDRLAANAEQR